MPVPAWRRSERTCEQSSPEAPERSSARSHQAVQDRFGLRHNLLLPGGDQLCVIQKVRGGIGDFLGAMRDCVLRDHGEDHGKCRQQQQDEAAAQADGDTENMVLDPRDQFAGAQTLLLLVHG